MKKREGLIVTIALLACAIVFFLLATRLSSVAALVPLSVALLTAVLIAFQLLVDLRKPTMPANPTDATGATERSLALFMLALLFALYLIGFVVALPLGAGLYWRWRAEGSWATAAVAAVGVGTFVYGGLVLLLRVDFFPGVLWTWMFP